MDDISVYGGSFEKSLINLEIVLHRCIEKNLVLNWEKCHFMVNQGFVLGHIISNRGIEVDKAKIELIFKLPSLTNVKTMRQFLGHAGFYKRFIKDFSKIAKPIYKLLEKDAKFSWDEDCQRSFEELKTYLTTAPVVRAPNWNYLLRLCAMRVTLPSKQFLGREKMRNLMWSTMQAKLPHRKGVQPFYVVLSMLAHKVEQLFLCGPFYVVYTTSNFHGIA